MFIKSSREYCLWKMASQSNEIFWENTWNKDYKYFLTMILSQSQRSTTVIDLLSYLLISYKLKRIRTTIVLQHKISLAALYCFITLVQNIDETKVVWKILAKTISTYFSGYSIYIFQHSQFVPYQIFGGPKSPNTNIHETKSTLFINLVSFLTDRIIPVPLQHFHAFLIKTCNSRWGPNLKKTVDAKAIRNVVLP